MTHLGDDPPGLWLVADLPGRLRVVLFSAKHETNAALNFAFGKPCYIQYHRKRIHLQDG